MERDGTAGTTAGPRPGTVRTGFRLADLAAFLLPFVAAPASELTPALMYDPAAAMDASDVFVHDTHGHIASLPISLLWLTLPMAALVHHLQSRRRGAATVLSMPMVRVVRALALAVRCRTPGC